MKEPTPPSREPAGELDREVAEVLRASRALVGIAARSLAQAADVTLPQYRALVVLAGHGPATASALARHLGVHNSTVTRLVDRLVDRELVRRERSATSGREVQIRLAPRGRRLLAGVTARREREIRRVLEPMSPADRAAVADALRRFGSAAGEIPDRDWALGW